MRITDFYIDGFGIFHNLKIEALSPELTVFLGMNESGKSTLLGFLRAILFGFPDRRSNENLYPPLAGGQHGGNLTLVTDEQHLHVVERYPGPRGGKVDVLKPDQTRGGKECLGRLLGMANRSLFRNIYAFSLSELQEFETLNTESVREALYSAGAGIDPNRLANLKSGLEKREGELYKPGGSKPRINALLSRLNAISKEKKALRGSVEEYDRIKTQISQLKGQINALGKSRIERSVQLKRTEQWIHIWPEWISLSLAKEKLEELEIIDHFPSQGVSRFETLKTRSEDLQNELLKKQEDLKRQESELAGLKIDPDILKHAPSIRELQREQGLYEAVAQEQLSIQEQLSAGERKLMESLDHLGPEWTEKKILEFDISIATREEVRRYREILQQASLEVQKKKEFLELMNARKNEAEEVIRNSPEPDVKDPERLTQMRKSCSELRRLESEDRFLKEELRNIEDRLDDLEEEKGTLRRNLRLQTYALPLWLVFILMGTGLFSLILSGLHMGRMWTLPSGVLLLIIGLLLWYLRSRVEKNETKRSKEIKQRNQHLTEKIGDLSEKRSQLKTHLDGIKEAMLTACSDLSISQVPSGEDLERMGEQLSERTKALERWMGMTQELAQAGKRQEEARLELKHAESEAAKVQNQWQGWLEERGLSPILTPEGGLETLSSIESFREQVGHLTQLRAKMASLEKTKQEFLGLANRVFKGCNRDLVGDDEIQSVVHDLIQEFQETERADQKRALLTNEMKANQDAVERIQKQRTKIQEEIHDLMMSGGADDEEGFRKRAQIYDRRISLKADAERHEETIRRHATKSGAMDSVEKKLSATSLEELEEEKLKLENELKDMEANLDRLNK
ncbi:MAG: AAA family ATPase, partial [Desulfobacteraceae bacterium]